MVGGRVFIDVTGSPNRVLEFMANFGTQHAAMGDTLRLGGGISVSFEIRVKAAVGGNIEIIQDGRTVRPLQDSKITQPDQSFSFDWTIDPGRHWFRVNVRDNEGPLWLVGNPIYFSFE
jgi:hypothetical protein